jgi:hypothetical protein
MAELKTKRTKESVREFIDTIDDEKRREDCVELMKVMGDITKEKPAMWGPSIVGFGTYHYQYESGREGDWFLTGFSPRKGDLTIYILAGFDFPDIVEKLGKYNTGKSCLYVKRLDDLHMPTLKKLIRESIKTVRQRYPETKKAK